MKDVVRVRGWGMPAWLVSGMVRVHFSGTNNQGILQSPVNICWSVYVSASACHQSLT